jgi:hypothetical protein
MPSAILVAHLAGKKISDCFKPSMGVRRKPREVIIGIIGLEKIQQQERIQLAERLRPYVTGQTHTRPIGGWLPRDNPIDFPVPYVRIYWGRI